MDVDIPTRTYEDCEALPDNKYIRLTSYADCAYAPIRCREVADASKTILDSRIQIDYDLQLAKENEKWVYQWWEGDNGLSTKGRLCLCFIYGIVAVCVILYQSSHIHVESVGEYAEKLVRRSEIVIPGADGASYTVYKGYSVNITRDSRTEELMVSYMDLAGKDIDVSRAVRYRDMKL